MLFHRIFKFYERIGLYGVWAFLLLFHGLVLWDVGHYVMDDSNWGHRFDPGLSDQLGSTLRKIEFVEKQHLTDDHFRRELIRRAIEDCTACGLDPYPGYEKARAVLGALRSPDVRQRYEFWHSVTMLAWILFWVLNLLLAFTVMSIPTHGMMRYLSTTLYLLPFLTLLWAATTPDGNIMNFVDDVPLFVGMGRYLLYFSIAFPILGWPLALGIGQKLMQVESSAGRRPLPNPYNYKPPKDRLAHRNRR